MSILTDSIKEAYCLIAEQRVRDAESQGALFRLAVKFPPGNALDGGDGDPPFFPQAPTLTIMKTRAVTVVKGAAPVDDGEARDPERLCGL